MDLKKIAEIRERNRVAMEAENAAKAAAKAEEAAREANAERFHAEAMAQLVDLLTSPKLGGRPLSSGQLARLKEIRLRNQIMATVAALGRK